MSLDGHVALVTGGTGALGTAVAEALLAAGATVHVTYVVPAEATRLQAALAAYADRLHVVQADVGKADDVSRVVDGVVRAHGRLDVLTTLVGTFWGGVGVADTPEDRWDFQLHVNLKTVFLCVRAVLPHMRERQYGRIVAISSRAGLHGAGNFAAYSVSKAAVVTLIEAVTDETREHGICANVVAPGTIDTEANRRNMPDADPSRWVSPAAIARVIAFLASPDAAPTSGAVIPVFGRS